MKIYVPSAGTFKNARLAHIDSAADAARLAIVGDAGRIKEYERAQEQAEQYKAAGYVGIAPSSVQIWAEIKGWDTHRACDDILAAAARWHASLDVIRALRLQTKEAVRHATSAAVVDALVDAFPAQLAARLAEIQ